MPIQSDSSTELTLRMTEATSLQPYSSQTSRAISTYSSLSSMPQASEPVPWQMPRQEGASSSLAMQTST